MSRALRLSLTYGIRAHLRQMSVVSAAAHENVAIYETGDLRGV